MADIDFKSIYETLKEELISLSKKTLKDFRTEASEDVINFLHHSEEKLKRWTTLLAEGQITEDDFKWLVESQKDLVVLEALKRAGISAIRLDEFKQKIIDTIIGSVSRLLGI